MLGFYNLTYIFLQGSFQLYHVEDNDEVLLAEGNDNQGVSSFSVGPTPTSSPTIARQPTSTPRTTIQVDLSINDFPEEVSWFIKDFNGRYVTDRMQSGHYSKTGSHSSFVDLKASGVYTLFIKEDAGRSNGK